jgi:AraC family transcriptional regulator
MQPPSIADYPPGAEMAPRTITDFEFVWMLRGSARYVSDDTDLKLRPGQLLLIPRGVPHRLHWDPLRPSRHGYVHFDPEQVGRKAEAEVRLRRMSDHDPMAGLCAYLLWLGYGQARGWEVQAERTLQLLLTVYLTGPLPDDEPHGVLPRPLSAAVDYLRAEWGQMPLRRLSVEELAAAVSVSRSYLNRLFRDEFGASPAAVLEALRCSRAETLLTRTTMPIGSIAHQCGFADPYHFAHRFTRRYGMSPSAFRAGPTSPAPALDDPGSRRFAYFVWG